MKAFVAPAARRQDRRRLGGDFTTIASGPLAGQPAGRRRYA